MERRAMPDSTFEEMERRQRAAQAPVDPPIHLQKRLEQTLDNIVELAADELESWEIEAIKDPRNWPRAALGPATAVVLGSGASVGHVVLRTHLRRHKRRAQSKCVPVLSARTVLDAAREALKVFNELTPDR
jgi:hypothetical protein